MDHNIKHCIINVGVNGWYPKGSARLERSLHQVGFQGDALIWKNKYPPGSPTHEAYPYALKIYAFEEAIRQGYTHILWADSSTWAVKNPAPIFDIINETGYWLWDSTLPVGETCNDYCLNYFGVARDEAMEIQDISTSIVGINITNPTGFAFFQDWKQAMLDGCFRGSRTHNPAESSDSRFRFHRQDQSAASLCAHKHQMKIHGFGEYSTYMDAHKNVFDIPENVIFLNQGM